MKININDIINVKLTEYGMQILRDHHERAVAHYPKSTGKFAAPPTDCEGYVSWELWRLMSAFGSKMYNGSDHVFENNEIFTTPPNG